MKYLVFLDLDGTLIVDHRWVTEHTKQVIRQLQVAGVQFYLASGRMYPLAEHIRRQLNSAVSMIACNGAIVETPNGILQRQLGIEAVMTCYQVSQQLQLPLILYTRQRAYYTYQKPPFIDLMNHEKATANYSIDCVELQNARQVRQIAQQVTNGEFASADFASLQQAKQLLKRDGLLKTTSSSPDNLELLPCGVNKASAIRKIQQIYQIDAHHTLAFGDSANDLAMLATAEISVAMGNAIEEVKQVAKYITTTNAEDGVAKFLEGYFIERVK